MPDNIHIKLPDGSDREFPKGTTALEVAKSISPRLADAAIAAKTSPLNPNGDPAGEGPFDSLPSVGPSGQVRPAEQLIDLTRPLEHDTELRILTDRDPEALGVYRHSS